MLDTNTERFWEQLLDFIEDGLVIPVIGPELLILEINGETTHLYTYLAQQLARRLKIDFQPEDSLNTVVCRHLSQGGQREDIYPDLKRVMPQITEIKLPEALIKLAEIRPLNLFVTTSFDPLLVYALDQVRYGAQEKTQVLAFFPESNVDLPVAAEQLDRATVYHMYGKLTVVPEYAVTDEDVLEFMHALQSRTSRPERLFDALTKQSLIVAGCPLSDWLGRFFIRVGKKDRLYSATGKIDFMVGDQLQNELNLTEFLSHFSKQTKVFPLTSIEFVNELHRRWVELHPPTPQSEKSAAVSSHDADKMQRGAVFLSYASEDRPAVILIRDALEEAGIDVWFDRNPDALRVGENFDAKIRINIDQCSLFIPIISRNTLTRNARFFRTEWNHAQNLAGRYPENQRFIIPVAIDETPPDEPEVPEKFRKLHWERMQGGQTHGEFVNEIKRLYRDYQRTHTQPA